MSFKTVVLLLLLMPVCAGAQRLNLRGKGFSFAYVFGEIKKQLDYDIIYTSRNFEGAPTVDVELKNADIRETLNSVFAGLQLGYHIDNRSVSIYRVGSPEASIFKPLQGRVFSAEGQPLAGASITIDSVTVATTDATGSWRARVRSRMTTVTISYLGYSSRTVELSNTVLHVVVLQSSAYTLDNVVVQAYGKTTPRLSMGSVSSVKASDINTQPEGTIAGGLAGRVPGLQVKQYNGVPGAAYGFLVRGLHSIAQGTEPLIIVDGMPVAGNSGALSIIGSGSAQGAMGAASLNGIPLSSVASIEVLKGASATAIYGSRGANGVILITLKQGLAGKARWNFDLFGGVSRAVKTSPNLGIVEYRGLRREAIANDGVAYDSASAPELFAWDSTRNIDLKKMVMGHTGLIKDARAELSGGDTNTVYLVSGSYHGEGAAFGRGTGQDWKSLYGHLMHSCWGRHLRVDLSAIYSWGNTELPIQDLSIFQYSTPNTPAFRDGAGQLQWADHGVGYTNIEALYSNQYRASLRNQLNHLQVSYEVLPGLELKGSFGYSRVSSDENSRLPLAGQDPASAPVGHRYYTGNTWHSELAEGYAQYVWKKGGSRLDALFGVNWQQQRSSHSDIFQDGFTSDAQLSAGVGAGSTTTDANAVAYRYEAGFGRLSYSLRDRYLVNVSGRRDGSSRFGPGRQFGNFWAVSSAWVFSDESFMRRVGWLSYGKIRAGIGTTGNDQIGDNQFAQVYGNTSANRGYQGRQGVIPVTFANDQLAWEVNYSTEVALDLGFLKNKVVLSAIAYRDWTNNQLVYTSLPSQAGLPGVFSNFPADVVNKGLEFTLTTHNWVRQHFRWVSTLLLTVPGNRLRRFPGLAASTYAGRLYEGKPLSEITGYHYTGVDPSTGLFTFRDFNKNGVLDPGDRKPGGDPDLRWYGGLDQNFQYRRWELDVFFEYRVGKGVNPLAMLYQLKPPPGQLGPQMLNNGPVEWLDHWRAPGDGGRLQRLTANPASAASQQAYNYTLSDALLTGASFVRLKSLALRWRLPEKWVSKAGLTNAQVYLQGQNLLTWTKFPVTDPETQDPTVLPPMRMVTMGCHITL